MTTTVGLTTPHGPELLIWQPCLRASVDLYQATAFDPTPHACLTVISCLTAASDCDEHTRFTLFSLN